MELTLDCKIGGNGSINLPNLHTLQLFSGSALVADFGSFETPYLKKVVTSSRNLAELPVFSNVESLGK